MLASMVSSSLDFADDTAKGGKGPSSFAPCGDRSPKVKVLRAAHSACLLNKDLSDEI